MADIEPIQVNKETCVRQLRRELKKWQDPQEQRAANRVRRGTNHKYAQLIKHYQQLVERVGSPNEAINLINSLRNIFASFEVG
jgi:hypothetical protein